MQLVINLHYQVDGGAIHLNVLLHSHNRVFLSFPYPSLHFHIATHRKARAEWNLNALENVAILILFQSIFVKSINAVVLINK